MGCIIRPILEPILNRGYIIPFSMRELLDFIFSPLFIIACLALYALQNSNQIKPALSLN